MVGLLSTPDAMLLVALVSAAGAYIHDRRAMAKRTDTLVNEFRNNGGSTMRDAVDRIERKLDEEVVPRLDRGATVMAEHADRLAVLEGKPRTARTRKGDK